VIYFVQSGNDGPIKIGYTSDVARRINKMQCDTPHKLHVLGVLDAEQNTEKELHSRFAPFRYRAEWYNPEQELLDYAKEHMEPYADPNAEPSAIQIAINLAKVKQGNGGVKELTSGDVARIYGVNECNVRRWCESGKLAATKLGHIWVIDSEALKEFKRPKRGRPFKAGESTPAER
jgi:hypothetical protein